MPTSNRSRNVHGKATFHADQTSRRTNSHYIDPLGGCSGAAARPTARMVSVQGLLSAARGCTASANATQAARWRKVTGTGRGEFGDGAYNKGSGVCPWRMFEPSGRPSGRTALIGVRRRRRAVGGDETVEATALGLISRGFTAGRRRRRTSSARTCVSSVRIRTPTEGHRPCAQQRGGAWPRRSVLGAAQAWSLPPRDPYGASPRGCHTGRRTAGAAGPG